MATWACPRPRHQTSHSHRQPATRSTIRSPAPRPSSTGAHHRATARAAVSSVAPGRGQRAENHRPIPSTSSSWRLVTWCRSCASSSASPSARSRPRRSPTPAGRCRSCLLPSIGGGDTIRGLANRRFHDRSRVVLTAEYLWRPSRYIDMALFVDSGAVGPRLRTLDRHQFQTAYGIGARLHGPAFTALRVEAARGSRRLAAGLYDGPAVLNGSMR